MYEKTHDNLLAALQELNAHMNNDGTAVAIGLQAYLKAKNVAYNHDTAKYLYGHKIIGRHKDSTHKNPLIFWNIAKPPSSAMVYEIIAAVKKARKEREERAKRIKYKSGKTEKDILIELRIEAIDTEESYIEQRKYLKKKIQAQQQLIRMLSDKINKLKS